MATHQTLSGTSDEEFLQRLVSNHPERFGAGFLGHVYRPCRPRAPVHNP